MNYKASIYAVVHTLMLCLLLQFTAVNGAAQAPAVDVSLEPIKKFYIPGRAGYGIFGPMREVELKITLVSEQEHDAVILEPGFFRELRWELANGQQQSRPLAAMWSERIECGSASLSRDCAFASRLVLAPRDSVQAYVTLRTPEPVLESGEYMVVLDSNEARSRVLRSDGTPWKGAILERTGIRLAVQEVTTAADRRLYHRVEAGAAMAARDYAKALAEYRLMTAQDPGDQEAIAGVGVALLRLRRFAEAAAVLESVQSNAGADSLLHLDLALAYLALGQESRAEALIRRYVPGDVATDTLNRLRAHARLLTSKPRS